MGPSFQITSVGLPGVREQHKAGWGRGRELVVRESVREGEEREKEKEGGAHSRRVGIFRRDLYYAREQLVCIGRGNRSARGRLQQLWPRDGHGNGVRVILRCLHRDAWNLAGKLKFFRHCAQGPQVSHARRVGR